MASQPRTIDVAGLINSRRLGAFNYKLILLSLLITIFDGFDMMMISFTAPYMRDELALSTNELGKVFSAGTFGALLGALICAYLGDRYGRRRVIVGALFLSGVLTVATGFARQYELLLVVRFLSGIAIGGVIPLAWALNIEFVPSKYRATVVTVIMVGYSVGSSIAGPLTVALAPHYGWEGVFFAGGGGTIAIATLLFFTLPESVRFLVSKGMRPDLVASTLKRAMPDVEVSPGDAFVLSDERRTTGNFRISQLFEGYLRWLTPLLWAGYIMSSVAIFFKASWSPIVLESLDFTRSTAAYVSSVTGFAGAIIGLMLMRFTDRIGPLAVAVVPLIAAPMLLVAGLLPMAPATFLIVSGISTALVGGAHFGVTSIAGMFYPSAIRANGSGWAGSIAKIGGIFGPLIGGWVIASGVPVIHTFALMAICPVALALCLIGIHGVVKRSRLGEPMPIGDPAPAT